MGHLEAQADTANRICKTKQRISLSPPVTCSISEMWGQILLKGWNWQFDSCFPLLDWKGHGIVKPQINNLCVYQIELDCLLKQTFPTWLVGHLEVIKGNGQFLLLSDRPRIVTFSTPAPPVKWPQRPTIIGRQNVQYVSTFADFSLGNIHSLWVLCPSPDHPDLLPLLYFTSPSLFVFPLHAHSVYSWKIKSC